MSDSNKRKLVLWIVAFVLSVGTFCACFFIHGDYTNKGWMDACFYSSGIMLMFFLLYLVARAGAFDMLRYGVGDIFNHMRVSQHEKKYKDYVDYVQQKKEIRKRVGVYPWPWIAFVLAFFALSMILYFTSAWAKL